MIHVDGKSIKSCTILAVQADGCDVLTIEGLADRDLLHPMQRAFHENHGLQCGFCTPGMIMSAIELIKGKPDITEQEIRQGLEGNLCRCTGYQNIVKSIQEAKQDGDQSGVLHKGISKRMFTKSFSIADDVEVKGAELKDGLLTISLERIIPESKKPRTIEIK